MSKVVRAGTSEVAAAEADLCIALGGDGTILNALRLHAGTHVPVFGINFGTIGSSAVLGVILVGLIIFTSRRAKRELPWQENA